jgi:hypothetical protein
MLDGVSAANEREKMFDPLVSAFTYILVEAFKDLNKFLNEQFGLTIVFDGWVSLATALATVVIATLNALGGKLPTDVQAWIPVVVKIVLEVLGAIGIKATVKRLAR